MESYQSFSQRNVGNGYSWSDDEMQRNYQIACNVEKHYNETYTKTDEPQIGDIVEFADEYHVYYHAKIVENLYNDGKLCICEQGSSFTYGHSFSTSGGAFVSKDKSQLQLVGQDENIVWTWGCLGAGAHQGIYFPLKVRKWLIPYNPKSIKRSLITFNRDDNGQITTVEIRNSGDLFCTQMSFRSLEAFHAWAKYAGYNYRVENHRAYSNQHISTKCWCKAEDAPANGKPIKVLGNGRVHDGFVVTHELTITNWYPNIYDPSRPRPEYGSEEYKKECDKELADYRKYADNPLGV